MDILTSDKIAPTKCDKGEFHRQRGTEDRRAHIGISMEDSMGGRNKTQSRGLEFIKCLASLGNDPDSNFLGNLESGATI